MALIMEHYQDALIVSVALSTKHLQSPPEFHCGPIINHFGMFHQIRPFGICMFVVARRCTDVGVFPVEVSWKT